MLHYYSLSFILNYTNYKRKILLLHEIWAGRGRILVLLQRERMELLWGAEPTTEAVGVAPQHNECVQVQTCLAAAAAPPDLLAGPSSPGC